MLDSCFRQVEFAGVLKGTAAPRPRRASSSTSCSPRTFQADIPLQMFVFPVRDGTPLPAVFTKFARGGAAPADRCPRPRSSAHRDDVDRAVDRHRAAVTARTDGCRRGAACAIASCRSRSSSSSSPIRCVVDRRARSRSRTARSTSIPLGDVVTDPALRHIAWFTVWQATLSTVLTLPSGCPARTCSAPVRVPRDGGLVRALVTVPFVLPTVVVGVGVRRAARRRRTARLARARPDPRRDPARARVLQLRGRRAHRRERSGRTSTRARRRRRACSARTRAHVPSRSRCPRCGPRSSPPASIVFLFTFTSFGVILILGGPAPPRSRPRSTARPRSS